MKCEDKVVFENKKAATKLAIREANLELQQAISVSPFIDYEALKEEYGY